jgi:replicative DNA helicase
VFYNEAHKIFFEAMAYLQRWNDPIDMLTVSSELKAW